MNLKYGYSYYPEHCKNKEEIDTDIELSVMHAFCHGVELMTHFQYKTFRSGAEQLNYALLDQDRVPRRRYREFQKTVTVTEVRTIWEQ